jgi:hypothetical protein
MKGNPLVGEFSFRCTVNKDTFLSHDVSILDWGETTAESTAVFSFIVGTSRKHTFSLFSMLVIKVYQSLSL